MALLASAGGIDALRRVLSVLPADLPATVLVALHQDPHRASRLVDILARHSRLPTTPARDRQSLQPGTVLVVPTGRHLLVTDPETIGLIPTGNLPPSRPSGDLLLSTLAVSCGDRALAVVLSGKGHDGQAGVRAVAHCGGTVFAQDTATAQHAGMPAAAIATDRVHRIVPLDEMADAVTRHVLTRSATHPWE